VTGTCSPERLYPPAAYLVPPPAGGVAGLQPGRRSGIPVVDAVLDAAGRGDAEALERLAVFGQTACGPEFAPPCPPGSPAGTPVQAFPVSACHGGYSLPGEAGRNLAQSLAGSRLYAVVEQGKQAPPLPDQPEANLGVALLVPPSPPGQTLTVSQALLFSDKGVVAMRGSCGPWHPEWLAGSVETSFLLPPP